MNSIRLPLALVILLLSQSLLAVSVAWECRVLANELMQLQMRGQRLQVRSAQLLLEESSLAALPRIESLVSGESSMRAPRVSDVRVLAP